MTVAVLSTSYHLRSNEVGGTTDWEIEYKIFTVNGDLRQPSNLGYGRRWCRPHITSSWQTED